jgi:hypothetical protein
MSRLQFWLFLSILPTLGIAQQANRQHYTGLNLGVSVIQEDLREGYAYRPVTLLAETSLWLMGPVSVYAEGQLVYADTPMAPGAAYEAGLNMGFRYQAQLTEHWLFGAAIGSGPHYISLNTESQAPGFIFSDNFELGFSYLPPNKDWGINLRARFRHISNAGFKYPNLGLDNLFVILGVRQTL